MASPFLSHSYVEGSFCLNAFLVFLLKTFLDLEESPNHIPTISSILLFLFGDSPLLLKGTCFHNTTENPLVYKIKAFC